jgi:hypothetical protein
MAGSGDYVLFLGPALALVGGLMIYAIARSAK